MWFETTQTKGITIPKEKLSKRKTSKSAREGKFYTVQGAKRVQPASYTIINNNSN